jgi:two-component system sensor histidine kinase SenX3
VIADEWFARRSAVISAWLAALMCCGIAALAWFGYRATNEWQRSSGLLVDRRADEVANMMVTGLTRDMRAVQTSVLDGRELALAPTSPYAVIEVIAGAFARYPYPEVFFRWGTEDGGPVFFARTDRLPPWLASAGTARQYPVELLHNPEVATRLRQRIQRDVVAGQAHSIFEIDIDGATYQVIARPTYSSPSRDIASDGFAFLVNLDWAQRNYFPAITGQVTRIAGAGEGIVSTIVDDRQTPLPGLPIVAGGPIKLRAFPVTFFDPMLTALNPPRDLPSRHWTVQVSAASDPTLALAARGARRTLIVIAAGAVALGLGLFVTTRAARAMANVSEMRSDFVSTVTHELKTPVQVIRSIGETLSRGRVSTGERLQEYAQLLVQEGHRLSRLIDNLLAYSRVTDVAQLYSFEAHEPVEIVGEALRGFHRLFTDRGFDIRVDVADTLPPVNADRTSLVLALDNLIDNAMRYSGTSRSIEIAARAHNRTVEIAVTDHGVGIAADELERVQRRFARGRTAQGHGSGLGLAIAHRIIADHGGSLRVQSRLEVGTTAIVALPSIDS